MCPCVSEFSLFVLVFVCVLCKCVCVCVALSPGPCIIQSFGLFWRAVPSIPSPGVLCQIDLRSSKTSQKKPTDMGKVTFTS